MNIQFNTQARYSYEVFGITEDRAEEIITFLTELIVNMRNTFPHNYAIESQEGYRPSIGQLLQEAIAFGSDDHEQAFILFIANTGIDSLIKEFDKLFAEEENG